MKATKTKPIDLTVRGPGTLRIGEGENAFNFVDVQSDVFSNTAWRLRYAQDSITKSDMFYIAEAMCCLSYLINSVDWLGKGAVKAKFDRIVNATFSAQSESEAAALAAKEQTDE